MTGWLRIVHAPGWLALICELLLLLAGAGYAYGLLRALAPKRRSLEWIAMYDRPEVSFALPGGRFRAIELLPCAVTALAAGVIYMLAVCLQAGSFALLSSPIGRTMLLGGSVVFALGAAVGFALLRSLYGRWPLAAALALLLSLDFFADYNQVFCLLLLLLFLHRWMRQDPEAPAVRGFGWLLGAEAMAAVSVTLESAMIFPVGCLALAAALTLGVRFHLTHRTDRAKQLALTLAFFVPSFYLLLLLCRGAAEVSYTGSFDFLADGNFYLRAVTRWCAVRLHFETFAGAHLPLLVLGVFSAAVSVYALFRYGHFEGLLLPAALIGVVLMQLLCGVSATIAAAVPACGYSFAHLLRRGSRKLALAGLAVCFVLTVLYDLALMGLLR